MIRPLRFALPALALALAAGAACAQPAPAPAAPQIVTDPATVPAGDWRTLDPENTVVMDTTKGRIIIELYPQLAPQHVTHIKTLVRRGFYDGVVFHRVIDGFMAQGGDPTGTGTGGSDLPNVPQEFMFRRGPDAGFAKVFGGADAELGYIGALPVITQPDAQMRTTRDGKAAGFATHCPGVLSMARSSDPNSANSQFFILRDHSDFLDRNYTIWGRAVVGADVARSFILRDPSGPLPDAGKPPAQMNADRMTQVRMLADIPSAERPVVKVARADGAWMKAAFDKAVAVRGGLDLVSRSPDPVLCDVAFPALVETPKKDAAR